eukprot:TRINITY_DN75097_c0_g1_i1.p1 TRINITY_DN75097_c0_g1~~TRINITY_DN75097_c0_g1_i1.p1  ORF type:complete len:162 (-),score=2.61 TRINITY_DN75097_c0_g1_i1:20-463(-)
MVIILLLLLLMDHIIFTHMFVMMLKNLLLVKSIMVNLNLLCIKCTFLIYVMNGLKLMIVLLLKFLMLITVMFYGWINHGFNAGDPDEFGYNTCSDNHAFADYGSAESGYDFLLVDHCHLETGKYYLFIRASPHEGSPERNCELRGLQ